MKKLNIKCLTILILLFSGSVIYSQTKKTNTYYPDDFTISYIKGINKNTNSNDTLYEKIQNINKVVILNDSMISISNEKQKNLTLNTKLISSVSLKKGSSLGVGIALGSVGGLFIGFLTGYAIRQSESSGSDMINVDAIYILTGSFLGMVSGMIVGGIIGGSVKHFKTYELRKPETDRKKELEKILKIDKKENTIDH